jgi:hypothetical protein
MKQAAFTLSELIVIVFAVLGVMWLLEKTLNPPMLQAPVVHVTINMRETKPKELTAAGHLMGLLKIGYGKFLDKIIFLPLTWATSFVR